MVPIKSNAQTETPDVSIANFYKSSASYIGEIVSNHYGGLNNGSIYHGMATFDLEFNTGKAGIWKNGILYLKAAHTHGGNPSEYLTGDFQVASNIEAENLTYFHEIWYSHSFNGAHVTIGLQDLNVEFAASENSTLFLNSSFGVHSTIADNIIAPIFPLTAFGIHFEFDLTNNVNFKLIAFDGFPTDFSDNNPYNLHWKFTKEDGLLNIAQLTWQPTINESLSGSYSFGTYTHHHISKESPDQQKEWEITNYGFYFVGDQSLITKKGSELSTFIQASISPYQKNENWYYLGTGLSYSGLFSNEGKDITGIAIAHAGFANHKRNETAIELTYQYNFSETFSVQPDIQYIINPAGTESILQNALVTALRFQINI